MLPHSLSRSCGRKREKNVGVFFMSSCFHTAVSPLMMCADNRAKHLVHDNKRVNFVRSNDKKIKRWRDGGPPR